MPSMTVMQTFTMSQYLYDAFKEMQSMLNDKDTIMQSGLNSDVLTFQDMPS